MTAPRVRRRDELVDQLVAGRRHHLFRYFGQVAPGEYEVEVELPDSTPVRRRHDVAGMSAWLDGFAAGRGLPERAFVIARSAQAPDRVRGLLNCPGVTDQRRIRVLHAMERRGWTIADVAAQLHAQRSTVRDLLTYGRTPTRVTRSSRRLDEIEALLPELARGYGRKPGPLPNRPSVAPLAEAGRPEPAELRRVRALALCVEAGIVDSWYPDDVNELRSARVVRIRDIGAGWEGADEHTVHVATMIAWLQGFADGAALAGDEWEPDERARVAALAHALS